MKNEFLLSSIIVIFFLLANIKVEAQNRPGLSIKETFDIYVKAVQNSDLKTLFTTVTNSDQFFFLTSRGKLIDTRESYHKFHDDWFKEKDWEMPVDFIEAKEGTDYGYTNAIYHYKAKMPDGRKYVLDSYFTLFFHKEDGMWKVVADVCTPIDRYTTEGNPELKYSPDQNYLFGIIKNRRTVRKFQSTPVPKEHIMKILDAARMAPTAGNQQPWKFLVIQDRERLNTLKSKALEWFIDSYVLNFKPDSEKLETVKATVKESLENVLSAPVYIAVLVDSEVKYPDYIIDDGCLATENLMIAAKALGYGTGFYTSYFPENKMKEFFNIPDKYKLICFTPIGVPEEWPETPEKKDLDELVVFENF